MRTHFVAALMERQTGQPQYYPTIAAAQGIAPEASAWSRRFFGKFKRMTRCFGPGGCRAPTPYATFTVRSRSALPITLTDESAIAAAATTGDSSRPENG